jgi:putative ABC transport system permease protein
MDQHRVKFLLKTAYRESRKNLGRLILFMSSIVAGVAALVSINSFNVSLTDDINLQAASLLGADIAITSNVAMSPKALSIIDSIPGTKASETELLSMVYIPKSDQSQFVKLKGLKGDFPFYGKLLTQPTSASKNFQNNNTILVEQSMMLQYKLAIGDSIKIGTEKFVIEGALLTTFGSASIGSTFAPTIYLKESTLIEKTGLVQQGSIVNYSMYYKTPKGFDADKWKEKTRPRLRVEKLRAETIDDRKENLREAFGNLNYFLNLVALISLLLGCIGVASSVFIYVKLKINSIAILRCLGLKTNEAFLVYFFQIVVLGFLAAIIGALIGSFVQVILPKILKDFLPMQVNLQISWISVLNGILLGTLVTLLFALLPLIEIRNISPLRTIRSGVEEEKSKFSLLSIMAYLSIFLVIIGFLYSMTKSIKDSSIFAFGILIIFCVLWIVSKIIMKMLRKVISPNIPFALRQGLSNLYRPNNQTAILLLSLGLGTSILTTLYLVQGLLLGNVEKMNSGDQANTILFGIESSQIKSIEDSTKNVFQQPVLQSVPIVTMNLVGWKGKTKEEWMQDSTKMRGGRWAMNREARVTYRDTIGTGESLVSGKMNRPVKSPNDSIYVSLGDSYAEALDVKLGDEMIFDVQGVRMKTYVGSMRKIEFNNMSTRFFILFPTGVLEEAPQFHVLVTKTKNESTTAAYRSSIVKAFPNVSVVDLGSILKSLNEIISKVSGVIKFMAVFSLITGIIVLISSLMLSKFQRINESVLLRTLGTKKKMIYAINFYEYLCIGLLSSLVGVFFAVISTYLIAKFQLKLDYDLSWTPILLIVLFFTLITVLIGLFNSREIVNNPPLEILRKEA